MDFWIIAGAVLIIGYIFFDFITQGNLISQISGRIHLLFKSVDFKEAYELHELLEKNNPFYRKLTKQGKERFIHKCFHFMKTKSFIGMEGLTITDEMIATISGTAAQLTFGIHKSSFKYYHRIKIFPETFYSGIIERELKGGTSINGIMYFSWKDFKEGYADETDRYNLGLHEMAHALRLELRYGSDFDERFANYNDRWFEIAMVEFEKMNAGHTSFLRDYASANMEEFFAVCIEHFFEVPEEFKENLPDIYNHLCFLLNIDPTNINDDFKLKPDFASKINVNKNLVPIPYKLETNYKYKTWHWSFNLIIAGFFIGVPVTIIFASNIMISFSEILLFYLVVLILITYFRKFFQSKGIFLLRHLAMFAIFGFAVNVLAIMMVLNSYFDFNYREQSYKIVSQRSLIDHNSNIILYLRLEGDALDDYEEFRKFYFSTYKQADIPRDSLVVSTTTGIFGLVNLKATRIK